MKMDSHVSVLKETDQVKIIVSDRTFRLKADEIKAYPKSLLSKAISAGENTELVFSRPLSSFKAVLCLYQTGQLHMPQSVCPMEFEKELKFWGFGVDDMEPCCLNKLRKFNDEFAQIRAFSQTIQETPKQISSASSLREKTWLVLDNQVSSLSSRAYLFLAIFFVGMSVITLSLSTVHAYKEPPTAMEIKKYLSKIGSKFEIAIVNEFFDKHRDFEKTSAEMTSSDPDDLRGAANQNESSSQSSQPDRTEPKDTPNNRSKDELNEKLSKAIFSKYGIWNLKRKSRILANIDYVVIGFFSVEMILRLATCPDKRKYFRCFFNILDAFINVIALIDIIITNLDIERAFDGKGLQVLFYFQIFRILRLLRIVKNVPAIKVLAYSFRSSYKDLFVLILYVGITVTLFGSAIYCVEDSENIENIPHAFWLCLITMTTVGYGDVTPKSTVGKLIGGLCALTGVVLLALVIPVFVSTFINLYEYAKYKKVKTPTGNGKLQANCIKPEFQRETMKTCWK